MDNSSFETVSLGDYFGVVWRRKWIVLLVTILFGAAGFLFAQHQTKKFASTASVVYNAPTTGAAAQKSISADTWGSLQVSLADTQVFAQTVHDSIAKSLTKPYTTQQLLNETAIVASAAGNGLMFTTTDTSPLDAQTIANGFANEYPVYLRHITQNSDLNKDIAQRADLKNKMANPDLYPPKPPDTAATQLAAWKLSLTKVQNDIALRTSQAHNLIDATGETSTVVHNATDSKQTQPKVAETVAIGAFIGFVVGILLAFLQDILDTRVRSAEEIGRRLRLPLLASVPTPPRQAGGDLVMLADPVPAIVPSTEAYRIAKLNLTAAMTGTGARVIMFTSAAEKDGTSPTVANLALVLARSGMHVVLVDANLRDPAQADQFGLHASAGLADVLAGTAKLADVLTGVDVRRVGPLEGGVANGRAPVDGILEVVPAGRAPYDPAELLDTRAAAELLRALGGRADVVLVDAPAILPVSDAMVLASKVDAVVVVARAGRDSRQSVVSLRRALDNCPAPGLAFVFTGASAGDRNEYGGSYRWDSNNGGKSSAAWPEERDPRDPREIGVL